MRVSLQISRQDFHFSFSHIDALTGKDPSTVSFHSAPSTQVRQLGSTGEIKT